MIQDVRNMSDAELLAALGQAAPELNAMTDEQLLQEIGRDAPEQLGFEDRVNNLLDAGVSPDRAEILARELDAGRGTSAQNPFNLRELSPVEALALLRGETWVQGAEGEPYQLPQAPFRDLQRPNDQPLEGGLIQRPQTTSGDVIRSLGTGVTQGIEAIAGMPGVARPDLYPSAEVLGALRERLAGDTYEPQTMAGEYARTIGEFAPGALAPGGAMGRLASVLVPAVASESAGQLTEGRPEEGAARVLGGLLGGLGVGGVQAVRGGTQIVLRNATQGVTEQQLAQASALRRQAEQIGVPLTQAEALQQITGGATGLGRVQRVVEGSTNRLAPMMAERPGQVRQAVGNLVTQVGPEVDPARATQLGQETAEGVINTMRQRVNESAAPFYNRLPGQTLNPADAATLQANPSYLRAQEAVLSDPELAPLITGGPDDLSTVNRVIQQLDQMESAATPGMFNPQGNRTIAGQRGEARGLAAQLASQASPDFATARQTVATGREAFVDPLKRGPLGTIAGQAELRPTLRQQTDALFPQAPSEGQANQTMLALQLMGEVNPQAGPALTRQFLATQANEILQDTPSGPNQFGGANLAARLLGNPEQERALLGAIDQANPFNDARRLAEVLRATGRREGRGSETAFNTQLQQDMRSGNLGQELTRAVSNPGGIPGRVGTMVDNFMTERNANKLAELLMADPDVAERELRRAMLRRSGGNRIRSAVALTQGEE